MDQAAETVERYPAPASATCKPTNRGTKLRYERQPADEQKMNPEKSHSEAPNVVELLLDSKDQDRRNSRTASTRRDSLPVAECRVC